jgi:GntR family transcriptional regulator/MocR family aminotransferase
LNVPGLIREAEARGVLIEPVAHYFARADAHENVFRMGITSLPIDRIRAGVAALAEVIRDMLGGAQPAGEQGVWLTGSALKETMSGATLLYKTVYGEPCSIELLPDGSMTGRAGYADEDRDAGRWWIEDDRWFRQWNNWAYGEPIGFHTTLDGDRIRWFNTDRRLIDSAVISRP